MQNVHLSGLPYEQFEPLFELSDDHLRTLGIERRIASADFGFPCRVSLQDAQVGDELLLLSYTHLPHLSPYRASGPIFVRKGATRCQLHAGVMPPYVAQRLISLRVYDAAHGMIDAVVCEGTAVADHLGPIFANSDVAYAHLHGAKRGCFLASVAR